MKTIILASGGTGGHIFPAISVSTELKNRGYKTVLITDKRAEKYVEDNKNVKDYFSEIHTISTSSLTGNVFKKANAAKNIGIGYFQAQKLIKDLKPELVIGFGGYPSFPTMYAAVRYAKSDSKLKTLIHEQNSILGRVNAILSDKVDKIATSFKDTGSINENNCNKQIFTGNPVRKAIKLIRELEYTVFDDEMTFKILVIGGSQGASIFSDIIPEAIANLPEEIKRKIRIDQQCRKEDVERVVEKYKEIGISADVASFYKDIAARIALSHLIITRSGASTVSEIAVAGRPAIFVPYKYAKDNHQMKNALHLKQYGEIPSQNEIPLQSNWIVEEEKFDAEYLKSKLVELFKNPELLKKEAEENKNSGIVDADIKLADLIEEMIDESVFDRNIDTNTKLSEESEKNEEKLDKMEVNG